MNRLFDPVLFDGKLMLWDHRARSDAPFDGFYHWHNCFEFLFVHEGEGTVIVSQQAHEIRRGMFFIFQPFQLHKVYPRASAEQPYIRTKLHFKPDEISDKLVSFPLRHGLLLQLWEGQGVTPAFDLLRNITYMEELCEWHERTAGDGEAHSQEEDRLLLLQILGLVQNALNQSSEPALKEIPQRPLRYSEKIMKWIETHFAEEVSLERIAEELHLSKFYVSRVFRQETGSSITDYLTARRIKQASRLLQTTFLPVEQVGIEVGLPDTSYFVQLFKKVVGTTPLKYRNQ
ncbi:AraC family transcriptional regulator [Cohnella silvisoli]|uniref:AraC family transcriptional regulator n=1 Tax=Cohnella silvisoli TaxID=2873699 RepID=A0ABV1KWR3_9BACL|nr:AraC family transcriptional regulator [Cohnella silvisoli]MCD9023900.1 AraC family transcriptional regulator [Cohnella silvisoli]